MDAYDLGHKISKYWAALFPKDTANMTKSKVPIRVMVHTSEGMRQVVGVHIVENYIQLELDEE